MDREPARVPAPRRGRDARSGMRDRIKEVATELLIVHGYNGTSFGEIAARLGTTTTNIHYHFGNKQGLVEEVVASYVAETRERHLSIWQDGATLREKIARVAEYNHERYRRFNDTDDGNRSWSLIGRLRLESEVLSQAARDHLATFTATIHDAIRVAVDAALRSGELREDAPGEELAFLLINIVNSSSVFTHGAGGFNRLKLFFDTFAKVMLSAYAPDPVKRSRGGKPPPQPSPR